MPTHEGAVCDFDWREMEALMFLSCIVVIKTRSALSWYQTYSTALQFSKITSAYLFFRMNVYVGLVYCLGGIEIVDYSDPARFNAYLPLN